MPITKYRCEECGNEFAKIFFTPEQAPRKCPACGTENIVGLGEAFEPDTQQAQRAMCISCDSCSEENSCG